MARFMNNAVDQPVFQLELSNGWTVSALKRWDGNVFNVSLAAWPTDMAFPARVHIQGSSEASDDAVAEFFGKVAKLDKPTLDNVDELIKRFNTH